MENLSKLNKRILQVPSINQLKEGVVNLNSLKEINIEDLLERNPIKPKHNLMIKNIENKKVVVTGAGGSIGSKISEKIAELYPKEVILIDNSEYNLYKVSEILSNKLPSQRFKIIICDCFNYKYLKKILIENKVDTIFHAAAYKHVSIVEDNPLEGLRTI